jgi:hypothetical protein
VRISVYVLVLLAIWIYNIDNRELRKSVCRSTIITSLSFAVAFQFGEAATRYSAQEQWVAIVLVIITLLSTICICLTHFLLCDRCIRSRRPNADAIIIFLTTLTTLALLITAATNKSVWIAVDCTRVQYTEVNIVKALSFTTVSLACLTFTFAIFAYYVLLKGNKRVKEFYRAALIIYWLSTWVFAVVTSEFLMARAFYKDKNGNRVALRASTWDVGQVMTIVMMALPLWDLINYYYGRYFPAERERESNS